MSEGAQAKKRRVISTLLLIAGVVAVVLIGARSRPVEITVRYDLSRQERAALRHLEVVWYLDGEEALRAAFSYGASAAPREQPQEVSLPAGDYRVESFLRFTERVRRLKTEVTVDADVDPLIVPIR